MEDKKIVDLNKKTNQNQNETPNVLEASFKALSDAIPDFKGTEDIAALLALPDEQFNIIAPIILMELEKSSNNLNDRLILVQGLNASGVKVEELVGAFEELTVIIDEKLTDIPRNKRDFLKRLMGMICNLIADTEGISKRNIDIPIELCHPDAKIPQYANKGDAGADIYAIDDYTIHPGETKIIPLGFKTAIPFGYAFLIHPRSGLSAKTKMRVANSIGLIDSGYRDQYGIIIENIEAPIKDITYEFDDKGKPVITSILHGSDLHITKGERIGQIRLVEVPKAVFYTVDKVEEIGENRGGGFGSTGLKDKNEVKKNV